MKSSSKQTARATGVNKELLTLIAFLVIFIFAAGAVYGYVFLRDRYDKEYIGLLGNQQVLSQRMTKYAGEVSRGSAGSFAQLKKYHDQFQHALDLLRSGNPESGMPASPPEVSEQLSAVLSTWSRYSKDVKTILSRRETVGSLREMVQSIDDKASQLVGLSDDVATAMAKQGAGPEQVYIASRQLMLSQRLINNVNKILEGDQGSVTAADRFGRDAALLGNVIDGMLNGSADLGITRVTQPQVREKLKQVSALYDQVNQQVGAILEHSPEMFQVGAAVQDIVGISDKLLDRVSNLESTYRDYMANRKINPMIGNMFVAVVVLLLVYMGFQLRREGLQRLAAAEAQRRESEEQNRRNQQAIMRLLDEMGDLADGDLTVNATVSEDITGAIADSINYAIEALRTLVTAINDTATKVSGAAQQTQSTAKQLAEASGQQAERIATASTAVNEMAISIEGVSKNADQLAEEAERSVSIAKNGAEVVQRTIHGMDTIREQIQETSKRIKRLGESSQEIGDIVELINDIAEQTNILALNAAIQAAMAGEAGRGFAVVADEVQRLAERSADATKQIEALVKTIQTDTNEAVSSMEQSTSGVVAGARLAEDAGSALGEIESVASHLAELVQNISNATRQQATASVNISETMQVIEEITNQTSTGTNQTAASIQHVAELADDLKRSVAGFKLPH
jgi:twitching motility protein PilJ